MPQTAYHHIVFSTAVAQPGKYSHTSTTSVQLKVFNTVPMNILVLDKEKRIFDMDMMEEP